MRSMVKTAGALAVVLLTYGMGTAHASTIEVNVPFPFLVRGETLPAGHYLIRREEGGLVQIVGEKGTRAGAFVLTTPAEGRDPAGNKPALSFTRHETQYQLSTIWESGSDGQVLARRRPAHNAD